MHFILIFLLGFASVHAELTLKQLKEHDVHELLDRIGELQIRANVGEPLGEADYNLGEALKLDVPEGDEMTEEEAAERGNNKEFEGDIMLAKEDREIMENGSEEEKSALFEELRSASSINRHKWQSSGGMVNVPYTITNEFDQRERALIARGFQDYENTACIRIVPRTNEKDYIAVFKGDDGACWSMIGRQGGMQKLSLGKGCPGVGVVVHEFMHALGYYHEQSRKDRDNYITVNWKNIDASMKHNFNKCKTCDDQGSPYDTTSVMQYATWAFSKNGKASMLKKGCKNGKGACKLGQYDGLAKSDIEGLNKLYCSGQTPTAGGCSDTPKHEKNCPLWTGKGYCEHTYVNFMMDHCQESCGFC